jgi:hypothetical protein
MNCEPVPVHVGAPVRFSFERRQAGAVVGSRLWLLGFPRDSRGNGTPDAKSTQEPQ